MIVRITEPAFEDLDQIATNLGRRSPQGATQVLERILRRVERLEQFPQSGSVVPEYRDEMIRELIEPPYRIIYKNFPDRVEIAQIVHSGRRLPRSKP